MVYNSFYLHSYLHSHTIFSFFPSPSLPYSLTLFFVCFSSSHLSHLLHCLLSSSCPILISACFIISSKDTLLLYISNIFFPVSQNLFLSSLFPHHDLVFNFWLSLSILFRYSDLLNIISFLYFTVVPWFSYFLYPLAWSFLFVFLYCCCHLHLSLSFFSFSLSLLLSSSLSLSLSLLILSKVNPHSFYKISFFFFHSSVASFFLFFSFMHILVVFLFFLSSSLITLSSNFTYILRLHWSNQCLFSYKSHNPTYRSRNQRSTLHISFGPFLLIFFPFIFSLCFMHYYSQY